MTVDCQVLGGTLFLLSRGGCSPILFAPLQGAVLEVNDAYASHLSRAVSGDGEAARKLGLTPSILDTFMRPPPAAERRIDPRWPEVFEPTNATIFLTHRCTLRCNYCYCDGGSGSDMSWPVFERAVRFAAANAARLRRDLGLVFHGGDVGACWPMFQRCVEFVERLCSETGVKTVLSIGTNGYYDREQAAFLSRHFASATLSIDGVPECHNAHRCTAAGQPSLDRVLDSVGVFDESGLDYSVRMTVTRHTLPLLSESVAFICRSTSARVVRAEPLYRRGRAVSAEVDSPDCEEFVEAFLAARKVARRHGRELGYSGVRPAGGVFGSFCSYPTPTFGVTPEGDLTSCYKVTRSDDPLRDAFFYGHIPGDGSSVDVDRTRIEAIRAGAKRRREECAGCFCVFSCAGDCAAKAVDHVSSEAGLSQRCRITRALVYETLRAVLAGEEPPLPADHPSSAVATCALPEDG